MDQKEDAQQEMMEWNGYIIPASCDTRLTPLAKQHAHPRDRHIVFDEEPHKYYIKGKTGGWTSVTSVVHEFFSHFNPQLTAKRMVRSRKFPSDPKYAKYRDFCTDEKGQYVSEEVVIKRIIQSWEELGARASASGTRMHENIERIYNGEEVDDDDSVEFRHHFFEFDAVREMMDLEPYRTEWVIYGEEEHICGSVDMIFRNKKTGKFVLMDWKRSKKISMKGYGKGKGACSDLRDCNFIHYSLQLNLYRHILEKYYEIKIDSMSIVVFHPNNPSFLSFTVADMQDKIGEMLAARVQTPAPPPQVSADIAAMFATRPIFAPKVSPNDTAMISADITAMFV